MDKSLSPLRTHVGCGFSSFDALERVRHTVDPGCAGSLDHPFLKNDIKS